MAKSVEEQLQGAAVEDEKPSGIEFIEATFAGTYFAADGGRGTVFRHFEETVRIPKDWLFERHLTPIGIFKQHIGPSAIVLGNKDGFSQVRTCRLVERKGVLPKGLDFNTALNWSATIKELAEFSRYETPVVKPELYPNAIELREAIRRCKIDQKAFIDEQEKRAKDDGVALASKMKADLEALGYV